MVTQGCINSSLQILRLIPSEGGSFAVAENYSYSEVFFLSYRQARIGGCIDAKFNVRRATNSIGSLAVGDRISISFLGQAAPYNAEVWHGTVDSFTSKSQNLEINCIGAWAALKAVFPSDMVFGDEADFAEADNENEFDDIKDPQAILMHLYNIYLTSGGTPGSDITANSLGAASTNMQVQKLELTGSRDFATIAEYLAAIAGNWAVGIDEEIDFFLTDPADYTYSDFKACETSAYQITDMKRLDSSSWLLFPTSLVIQGKEGYQETFLADTFGYTIPEIAGIKLDNQKIISVPQVAETEEKVYDSLFAGQVDVESVDAARYADMFFQNRAIDDPMRWAISCQNVNKQFFPWEDSINLFDELDQWMGLFTIEIIEYVSENNNLSIAQMEVKKLRPVVVS